MTTTPRLPSLITEPSVLNGKEGNVDSKRRSRRTSTARARRQRRIQVGRPWRGTLQVDVEAQRFRFLAWLAVALVALLGIVALEILLDHDRSLARQLLSSIKDILLFILGALSRSARGGR
jgi:hypothetical protein